MKKIYLQAQGDEPLARSVGDLLARDIQLRRRFNIIQLPEEANAALMLTVRREQAGRKIVGGATENEAKADGLARASASVKLVNAAGVILWPRECNYSYIGSPSEVATKIVRGLLDDIERLERMR